ncbi:putative transcriptional regulator, PucR family protein [Streptomyces sp. Tu6071]|uniref:helix-turn-helix domain-containing protein n=1 Tax=Streptomyces sp. Tu6071 TaxID=355249 RepID=UPI00020E632B|nr:helix-turn-helix domain-containing protein [Streptomyces sp. Tu6071]EGJ76583.1 putative transcriptional regulator, PucR family protein [Streptomyces sp. Tu6071]
MRELAGRLAALDPDAGEAVRVIAYFDRLTAERAGLEALVRGAAVLAGSPARLADPVHGVRIRVEPDGRRVDGPARTPVPPGADWPGVPVSPGGPRILWLEQSGEPGPVGAMVLERAATAVRAALDRTRGRAPAVPGPPAPDAASVEVLLDADAPPRARELAARRLGLGPLTRALARADGTADVADATHERAAHEGAVREGAGREGGVREGADREGAPYGAASEGAPRTGIGPAVPPLDLPHSYAQARIALRFTAEGTAADPGHRWVRAEELGGLSVLAAAVGPRTAPVPDVLALRRAHAAAPWALLTLHAVASHASLRTAAAALNVHHSTLQERLAHAERLLGWNVREPAGRLRLQLALALDRLHRSPAST